MAQVSVVVTTYNQASFIGPALESVFAQTFGDFELIVVDDGSIDSTPKVVQSFGPKIRYIRQDNGGIAAARNAGVAVARAPLVAFLDGDDIWGRNKLEIQVEAAARWAASALVAVNGIEFDDAGIIVDSLFSPTIQDRFKEGIGELTLPCYRDLIRGNLIKTMSQVMVRKIALDRIGPSNVCLSLCSDYDLYLRLARKFEFTFVGQRQVSWRYHGTSASGRRDLRFLRYSSEEIRILKNARSREPHSCRRETAEAIARKIRAAAQAAYLYGRDRDRLAAVRYLTNLWRANAWNRDVIIHLLALMLPRAVVRVLRGPRLSVHGGGDLFGHQDPTSSGIGGMASRR